MARKILKILNTLLSISVIVCLLVSGAYAGFALWDNSQVYSAAENVQEDMIKLKPKEDAEEGPSFEELLKINPDVCAWLTLDDTKIDYPVLWSDSSISYINTDVYGDFSLSGSIFLDSRNSREFTDSYNLLYGHHMEGGCMFGDLDKFKDADKFEKLGSGTLILPDRSYDLEVFAVLLVKASDKMIFEPDRWSTDISEPLKFVRENKMYVKESVLSEVEAAENPQVLVMTTCSSEFTDARTVVMAYMTEK